MSEKPDDVMTVGRPFLHRTAGSDNFRIPGIVTLNDGTLVASADVRWNLEKDGGGTDIIVGRSKDYGNSWNYTFAGYLGDNGNEWNPDSSTLMDPLLMTDGEKLYLFADLFPAGYSLSLTSTTNVCEDKNVGFDENGNLLLSADDRKSYRYYLKSGKIYYVSGDEVENYTVDGWFHLYRNGEYVTNLFFKNSPYQVLPTSYICMMISENGGASWSEPSLLNVKSQGTAWMVLGPGKGIVTSDKTMLFSAYDGSNVYVVFSRDNGKTWDKVKTDEANNESQLVELCDGTIRMFVKSAGVNKIQYIDFTPMGETYVPGSLVNTGVDNFSQCMVSALRYSRKWDGKEVLLVCCPSDSNGGVWGGRFRGKIYVFTLNDKNEMTLEGSYPLNDGFFAYSCMTERADGSIDLLYEDDCISYQAGSYFGQCSHITYRNVKLFS